MLNNARFILFLSKLLRHLTASLPAATIFWIGSGYSRALLWTSDPLSNHDVLIRMLLSEIESSIALSLGSVFVLFILELVIGDGKSLWRYFVGFILGCLLILLAREIVAALLNFTTCYGGPVQLCSAEQIKSINHHALVISVMWGLVTFTIDRILRNWGWGKIVAGTR